MIWFNLALFAVSFVLTALFAPKPEIENARPDDLDPNAFPQASENAPTALGLGCVRLRAPNTLWYGNFNPVPIKEKVKTGLFSSKTVIVGHENFLSLDMGLILGPNVRLKGTFIDSELVEGGSGEYVEQVNEELVDTDLPGDTSGNLNFDWYNLTDILGLTGAEVDQLTAQGAIRTDGRFQIRFNPGDRQGTRQIAAVYYDGNDGTGNELLPDPINATNLQTSGFDLSNQTWDDVVVPFGTRSIGVATAVAPLIPFGTTYSDVVELFRIETTGLIIDEFNADILEPELFGGRKSGGGWVGNYTFYDGAFDQSVDAHLEESLGVGLVPAYNGVSHVVYADNNIGETANLRKIEYLLARYEDPLETGFSEMPNEDHELSNALYFILIDDWAGLGIEEARFDKQAFVDMQTTLVAEGNHGSILVTALKNGKSVITEVLRQVDGVFGLRNDGVVVPKLIRDDYDEGTLPIYDEDDIAEVRNLKRGSWQDVKSEVKVIFKSRESESDLVALARDEAVESMVGRKVTEISFPLCYDPQLAADLAWRELSRLSVPLLSATLVLNRRAYDFTVGDVIKVTYPELGLNELIVRVQKVDLGERSDNRIIVDVLQDQFAASNTLIAPPATTGWQDARPEPLTIATWTLAEMPRFFGRRLDNPVEDGFGAVIPFPVRPQPQSSDFTLNADDNASELLTFDPDQVEYPYTATLTNEMPKALGFETGIAPSVDLTGLIGGNDDALPTSILLADLQSGDAGLMYVDGEWMGYLTATDNTGSNWTISSVYRGLFGTTVKQHAAGTRVYFMRNDLAGDGDLGGELLENGTIYYKLLDRVGGTQRSALSEALQNFVLSDIADRPLRPRNLQGGASRTLPIDASGMVTFTWSASNRESDTVSFEVDAAEVPDQTETYDLEVWIDGVQDVGRSASGVSSGHVVDFTGVTGITGEVRIYARRTAEDLKTSVGYAYFPLTFSVRGDTTQFTGDTTQITGDQT